MDIKHTHLIFILKKKKKNHYLFSIILIYIGYKTNFLIIIMWPAIDTVFLKVLLKVKGKDLC